MKKKTTLAILICGLALTLSGCIGNAAPTPASQQNGGMSGGGGGTLPAKPATVYEVVKAVEDAKIELRPLVRFMSWARPFRTGTSLNDKLFGGKLNLVNLLEEVKLDLRKDAPCKDRAGKEVDGSVANTREGAICISAKLIAPKVTIDSVRSEVTGLILHEMSHLLGTTEEEAEELQEYTVEQIRKFTARDLNAQALAFHDQVSRAAGGVRNLQELINSDGAEDERVTAAEVVVQAINSAGYRDRLDVYRGISVFDARGHFHAGVQLQNFLYLNQYLLCQSTRSDHAYWCDSYREFFGERTSVPALEIGHPHKLTASELQEFSRLQIRKITSKEILKEVVAELAEYYSDLSFYSQQLYYGSDLSFTSMPAITAGTEIFREWIGKYEIVSKTCSDERAERRHTFTSFTIRFDEKKPEQMKIRKFHPSGYGDEPVYNGAHSNSGIVELGTDASRPSWTATRGDNWKSNWQRASQALVREGGSLYFDTFLEFEGSNPSTERCRLELRQAQ